VVHRVRHRVDRGALHGVDVQPDLVAAVAQRAHDALDGLLAVGINPIVTLEKQLQNMIGKLV
jgi:hypothetical protein